MSSADQQSPRGVPEGGHCPACGEFIPDEMMVLHVEERHPEIAEAIRRATAQSHDQADGDR